MPGQSHARRVLTAVVATLALLPAGGAGAASFDSQAPEDAPPHWLPPEAWVYNHWVPYDEGRLYRLLRISRADLWQHLRDDRRTVAQLARRRGWPDVDRLATALVAPWRGRASRARVAVLRSRARRTLTQGHMAQHLFFHSLHQFAIASEAPAIFGVSDARFRELRRVRELSPLTIARLGGRSPARVEAQAIGVLRERIRAGVEGQAMTRRQAQILLRRQLTQLPRWLSQARYNGPPVTHRGKLVAPPHDYASNPAVSADGGRVVFEAYRQKLPQALRLGEIAVLSRAVSGERARAVSRSPAPEDSVPARPRPSSAYNATTSGDGRFVAYESAAGNANFAKRYGRIGVMLCDLRTGRTVRVDRPPSGSRGSKSGYNPVLSADGRSLAFQAVRSAGRAQLFVRDLRRGTTVLASRDLPAPAAGAATSIYEPALSADGHLAAFTVATVPARGGLGAASSRVYVCDLVAGVTRAVSPAGAGFASNPALAGDGRSIAFTATEAGTDQPRLLVHDLLSGTTRAIGAAEDGAVVDPQLSADGRVVAYTAIREGVGRVLVHDLGAGTTELVSRADGAGGAPADAAAGDPALSGDGKVVAFASEATNLAPAKPDATRGVFVRDLVAGTTTLVSAPSRSGPRAVDVPPLAAAPPEASRRTSAAPLVFVRDNEYAQGAAPRPDLTVRAGTVVRWRWASKQSHDVTVRSGPESFASPTKSGGGFSRRLRRPGTYRLSCSLHAPGMRMTVRVR